jgi:hypothetical protein
MLLAAFALMAAGCGGGDSNSAATTEAATTEVADTEEATTEEATTEEATTEEATTEETTATSSSTGLASGKCQELANIGQKYSQALGGTGSGQDLSKTADVLQEVADEAPAEIKDDFQVLADYLGKVADALGDVNPGQTPSAEQLQKLQELGTQVDAQKLQQASQNITSWVSKNCRA